MTPSLLALLLFVLGLVLLTAEFVVPAHGLTAACGAIALVMAVAACFWIHLWVGVAALAALALGGPVAAGLWMTVWPHTPLGKRLVLHTSAAVPAAPPVQVGQAGLVVSPLRPAGICEFAGHRIQASAEHGTVAAGTAVRVVAVINQRAIVRPLGAAGAVA